MRFFHRLALQSLICLRLHSACSCPGSDHPGPDVTVGRGAPEIDILEAEKDKLAVAGQVVSQSAQFAPFTHDYLYGLDSESWTLYNASVTRPNTYKGSAVQQAVSALTNVSGDGFQGSGRRFITYGFEYWSDPKTPDSGFITWQVDGSPSVRMGASAVGPDQGTGGSGVGQRLIPVEPMSLIVNLGISRTSTFLPSRWLARADHRRRQLAGNRLDHDGVPCGDARRLCARIPARRRDEHRL